jgi:hypothetical protein
MGNYLSSVCCSTNNRDSDASHYTGSEYRKCTFTPFSSLISFLDMDEKEKYKILLSKKWGQYETQSIRIDRTSDLLRSPSC